MKKKENFSLKKRIYLLKKNPIQYKKIKYMQKETHCKKIKINK